MALESVCLFKYSKRKGRWFYVQRKASGKIPRRPECLHETPNQDDFENIQFILNNYNCDRIDDNEDDDYDDSPSEPPAPKEEIDALFDEIRASCVGPVKPQNPNPRNHFYRKSR